MSTHLLFTALLFTSNLIAADDAASGGGAGPIGLSKLPPPWIIAHRGEPLLYPEHTMEAYRASVADGAKFVEVDCFLLGDGSVAVMHDDSLGRTTNSSWPTARMDRESWRTVEIIGEKLMPMQRGRYAAPMLGDVLKEFANKVILVVEAKNQGVGAAIVEMLRQHRVQPDFVLVNSFIAEELKAPKAAGFRTILNLWAEAQAAETQKLTAASYDYLAVPMSFSDATIRTLVDGGFKVIVATFQQHVLRDRFLRLGVHGIYSDDAKYLEGKQGEGPFEASDPYAKQTWYRGQLPTRPGRMGYFAPPDKWGLYEADYGSYSACLQGWCSPLNYGRPIQELTIGLTITFGHAMSPDRWAGILLSADDGLLVNDVQPNFPISGYNFVCRKNGVLQVYSYAAGVGPKLVTEHPGHGPIKTGEAVRFSISYHDGWITFGRAERTGQARFREDRLRYPYVFLGVKGLGAEFSNVRVQAR